MTSFNDPQTRRSIIMDHYTKPRNRGVVTKNAITVTQRSTKCVDHLTLSLAIVNDCIVDSKFQGEGCAIFLSSVDIMIDRIKNKTLKEVQTIINEYQKLINAQPADATLLGELAVYANVASHLNRLHCAELIALALRKVTSPLQKF